jgi:surface antigen
MHKLLSVIPLLATLALAGCGTTGTSDLGPTLPGPGTAVATGPTIVTAPADSTREAQALTDVTAFLDPAALGLLSAKERAEAGTAQYNALQFSRAGAPRAWTGDRGASGQVTVGPPVPVNSLYCRNFTHVVTVGGQTYTKQGMACREANGSWAVV